MITNGSFHFGSQPAGRPARYYNGIAGIRAGLTGALSEPQLAVQRTDRSNERTNHRSGDRARADALYRHPMSDAANPSYFCGPSN